MNISIDGWKAIIGMVLFLTWVGLVVFQVSGTETIVESIKMTLVGLASHYLTYSDPSGPSVTIPLGGSK